MVIGTGTTRVEITIEDAVSGAALGCGDQAQIWIGLPPITACGA
jgi:hypothetical protein